LGTKQCRIVGSIELSFCCSWHDHSQQAFNGTAVSLPRRRWEEVEFPFVTQTALEAVA